MKIIVFFVNAFLFLSCSNNSNQSINKAAAADTTAIINVAAIIYNDVQETVKTPYAIKQTVLENNRLLKDTFITNNIFLQLCKPFLQLPLQPNQMVGRFTETVFRDLSTKSVTINYTATDKNTLIKNIDVLMDETGSLPKRIFIKTIEVKDNTTITVLYSWKINKAFQINTTKYSNNNSFTEQQQVSWNDN